MSSSECSHIMLIHTVVPGRIARMMAEVNISKLDLKQTFIRLVSHEIRCEAFFI